MSTATIHRGTKSNGEKSPRFSAVPQLLNGDHLTVPEFEKRYEAAPASTRAELIEGIVVMSSPTSTIHAKAHALMVKFLGYYALKTPRITTAVDASLRLDGINEYQPDVLLWIESGNLSRTRTGSDGLLEGSPELAVEIAVSSSAYDLHEKKQVYQRWGVSEYFVWRVMDAQIQWFVLDQGGYVEARPRTDGVACSRVFPGLWLHLEALLESDETKVLRVLEQGLKTSEHRAFVRKVAA